MLNIKNKSRNLSDWAGFIPFLLFCLTFEIVPVLFLVRGSFLIKGATGPFTLANLRHSLYVSLFINSIDLSGLTAPIGVILGALIGYVIYRWPTEQMRELLITHSDVTANFVCAPLAFAFVNAFCAYINGYVATAFFVISFMIAWIVSMLILWVGTRSKFISNETIQAR